MTQVVKDVIHQITV